MESRRFKARLQEAVKMLSNIDKKLGETLLKEINRRFEEVNNSPQPVKGEATQQTVKNLSYDILNSYFGEKSKINTPCNCNDCDIVPEFTEKQRVIITMLMGYMFVLGSFDDDATRKYFKDQKISEEESDWAVLESFNRSDDLSRNEIVKLINRKIDFIFKKVAR